MAKIPDHLDLDCLNAAAADPHRWLQYKRQVKAYLIEAIAAAHAAHDLGINKLQSRVRLLHDTVYVADRIRKAAISKRVSAPPDLLDQASAVLAKPNYRGVSKTRRSSEEEKFVAGARVNWHNLVKRTSPVGTAPPGDILVLLRSQATQRLQPLLAMFEQAARLHPSLAEEINRLGEPLRSCLEKYTDYQEQRPGNLEGQDPPNTR